VIAGAALVRALGDNGPTGVRTLAEDLSAGVRREPRSFPVR
jgi:tryptophan synthase alpha chain